MDTTDFEKKIIIKLKADLLPAKSIEVRSYPDDFNNYVGQLKHPGGAILSALQSGFWEPPEGNVKTVTTQNALYVWQFNVLGKSLSSKENQFGIYNRLEEIRKILTGFTPAGFDDSSWMFPVDQSFLGREKEYYIYQITFANTIEESQT